MSVVSIIAGIILILGGVAVLFTPVETFVAVGVFVALLFLVYGISGLIKAFRGQATAWEIIIDIIAIIVGVVCIIMPGGKMVFDQTLLFVIAFWFVFQGILTCVISTKTKAANPVWFLGVLVGVISVILGIVSLFNPLFEAAVIGVIVGIYFIEAGINLILLGSISSSLKAQAKKAKEAMDRAREDYEE